jgi:hypothetical protein
MADAESQLESFIEKFDLENQSMIREVRAALRRRLPAAHELVYDNYNFFVIGYCSTERPSDCIVSIAASAGGISLSFYRGADLVDQHGVLNGSGSQNRFIKLQTKETIAQPEVDALIQQAVDLGKSPLIDGSPGKLIIRSISAKQRPRRKS